MLSIVDAYSTPPSGHNAKNPEDGVVLRTGTLDSLLRAWWAHRKAKEQPELNKDQLIDLFCQQLPPDCGICGHPAVNPYVFADLAKWREDENKTINVWGRTGWNTLHRHQISESKDDNEAWMLAFVYSIPCNQFPRRCQQHFQEYLAAHPVDWSNQDNYFSWTWKVHNDVNLRIGKPHMPLEEACALYANER